MRPDRSAFIYCELSARVTRGDAKWKKKRKKKTFCGENLKFVKQVLETKKKNFMKTTKMNLSDGRGF